MTSITESTFIKIKKVVKRSLKRITGDNSKNGGIVETVQIDKIACCRRRTIYKPRSKVPYIRDTKWVIGAICKITGRIKLKIFFDKRIKSIKEFFSKNISPGTYIKIYGFASYPEAVPQNNCTHSIINHSTGFVSVYREHTNTIGSLWLGLKFK